MTKFGDILFLIGGGLILFYFLISMFFPSLFKDRSKRTLTIAFILPLALIIISLLIYLISNLAVSNRTLPSKYIFARQNLDSLNKELSADTISLSKIDSIVINLQENQKDIKKLRNDQLELQKRVRVNRFNEIISDSILQQIENRLKEIKIKPNYFLDDKLVTHQGKLLTYNGKLVKISEKVYNDLYTVDSFEASPIIKRLDFSSETKLKKLNFYIDSVQIKFRVVRNVGKIKNTGIDSVLYLTISPSNTEYKRYKNINTINNQTTLFLDSIYFHENSINKIILDFPNTSPTDTLICFDFFLKRGIISSYCIPF